MNGELNVYELPRDVTEQELAGSAVIVLDILRATTTITQALVSGAREVVTFLEIADALAAKEQGGGSNVVLGGERRGKRIDAFDIGNSPSEYSPSAVGGKRVFITTTNGTRALGHARLARRVLVGGFVNLSALVASVKSEPRVSILCAGTDGEVTREDTLAAGAIVAKLQEASSKPYCLNAAAERAERDWKAVLTGAEESGISVSEQLALEFRTALGGLNLLEIGHDHDLVDCARVDSLDVAPELDIQAWRITA